MKCRNAYLNCGESPIKHKRPLLNHQRNVAGLLQYIKRPSTNHSTEIGCKKVQKGKQRNGNKAIAESLYKVNDTATSYYETPISIDIEPIEDLDSKVRELESEYEANNKKQSIKIGPFPGFLGLTSEELDKREKQKKFSEDLKKQIEEKTRIKNQQRLKEKEEAEKEDKRIQRETEELLAKHSYEKATEGKLFERHKPTVSNLQGTVMEDTIKSVQNYLPKFNAYPNDESKIEEEISEKSLRSNAKLVKVEDRDDLYKTWKVKEAMVTQEVYKPEEKVIIEHTKYIDPDSKLIFNLFS
jgi:hypothetical protein